jgi:hypothetical protein
MRHLFMFAPSVYSQDIDDEARAGIFLRNRRAIKNSPAREDNEHEEAAIRRRRSGAVAWLF